MFYLYVLQSVNYGTFYIGVAKDVLKRPKRHNRGLVKSTKGKKPWLLVYKESHTNLGEARKKEKYLKSLKKRSSIEKLIKHF